MSELKALSKIINDLKSPAEVHSFLTEILTENEISTLSKRWRILNLLSQGATQREISAQLGVSLCKVTRGAKILKNSKSVIAKCMIKEKNYANKFR